MLSFERDNLLESCLMNDSHTVPYCAYPIDVLCFHAQRTEVGVTMSSGLLGEDDFIVELGVLRNAGTLDVLNTGAINVQHSTIRQTNRRDSERQVR